MRQRGEFWVEGCANCPHPGGLHVIDRWEPRETHCRCCTDCRAYAPGEFIRWSDRQTDALASRHDALRKSAREARAAGQITVAELEDRLCRIAFMERQAGG